MNLPARPFGARLQNPVQIIRGMLRRRIWTYVAGTETILNGQQIHTFPPVFIWILDMVFMVVDGRDSVCSLGTQ